jgi:hypothetical protein
MRRLEANNAHNQPNEYVIVGVFRTAILSFSHVAVYATSQVPAGAMARFDQLYDA